MRCANKRRVLVSGRPFCECIISNSNIYPSVAGRYSALSLCSDRGMYTWFLNLFRTRSRINLNAVLPMDLAVAWASAMDNEKLKVGLQGNPWARPPVSIMSMGLSSAEIWWKDINRFGGDTSNKLKMVLVGLAEAGKTTIVRHLTGHNPPDERTIGVEVTEWNPRDHLPPSVSIWDFAGQTDYYASHHIFLTKGALFILVVDLFELVSHSREGVDDPRGAVFRWLDILHERVPGAAVALVGTHTGKFLPLPIRDAYRTLFGGSGESKLPGKPVISDVCTLIRWLQESGVWSYILRSYQKPRWYAAGPSSVSPPFATHCYVRGGLTYNALLVINGQKHMSVG